MTTPKSAASEPEKLWIIFRRFGADVIEHHPKDTRTYIAKKFGIKNPKRNLMLVQKIEPK